jgi:hypothetical protein
MTYYGPGQLAESLRSVRRHTFTIAEDIPEERYDYRPEPGSRSVRETLLHILSMTHFDLRVHGENKLYSLEGFDFRGFFDSLSTFEKRPVAKAEIIDSLRDEGDRWCRFVSQLLDGVLAEEVRMRPGMSPAVKTRFESCSAPRSTRCTIGAR